MDDWESQPTIPIFGRKHKLDGFSLTETRFFNETEVFYANINSFEHLSMSGDRVHLRLHLNDGTSQEIRNMPESFVPELSSRIESAD